MASGRRFLDSLDRNIDRLRHDYRQLDTELQGITRSMGALRRRESEAYQGLARLRLAELDDPSTVDHIGSAESQAQQLLDSRDDALAKLSESLDQEQTALAAFDTDRAAAADRVASASEALADKLDEVGQALTTDPPFVALRERSQALIDQAARAEEKTARAEKDRREKGKPYEADALFVYLWDRGYGTSAYRAWPLARLVDRMMARHIRFEKARRNYHLLTEIPLRLRRHTDRLEEETAALMTELAEFERKAEVAAGADELEQALEAATAAATALDRQIEAAEQRYTQLLAERERFANGQDRFFIDAMQVLVTSFKADPIPALRREAAATPTDSDDRLVRDLALVREEIADLEQHLVDQQEIHGRRMSRLNELSAVRSQYKRKRFDAADSVIDDRGKAELMLTEFMSGLISGDRLWRVIRHSQRFRPRFRSSSGGNIGGTRLPRMPRSVRIPRGMGGGGGLKFPRMPSGGGFRTKGGF
ncbi:MAG: hypothetical protein AAGH76_02035 [Pseudomonadota bacterium]